MFIYLMKCRFLTKMKTLLWRSVQCDVAANASQPPVCTTLLHSLLFADLPTADKASAIASPPTKRYCNMFRPQNMSTSQPLEYDSYQFKRHPSRFMTMGIPSGCLAKTSRPFSLQGIGSDRSTVHHMAVTLPRGGRNMHFV